MDVRSFTAGCNFRKMVSLTRVMSFENTSVPLSMFTEDGKMISCAKSQIVPCLEGLTESIPSCDTVIYDGHVCIQMIYLPQISGTVMFEDMARRFCDFLLNNSKHSNNGSSVTQLHVVFDRYLRDSIKVQTMQKRIAGTLGTSTELKKATVCAIHDICRFVIWKKK